VAAAFARANERLETEVQWSYCPHPEGRPVCWCRKPLPGLGVLLIERHGLDPSQSVLVGRDGVDQAYARALGLSYRSHDEALA
jgi:histidinol phosphatase-like enzyme